MSPSGANDRRGLHAEPLEAMSSSAHNFRSSETLSSCTQQSILTNSLKNEDL